ncbi:putative glucose kinase [Symbiobacterium thermophilum IAM 14863]|uniref:Putative glucose kinase n=2 Tax=Symbiobacterium thermophilum TaxID=2734 RepID=Q67LX2_SYMTH|nr:putative glucose kinase [Symbiobacterium thermophilum IAM 14863]
MYDDVVLGIDLGGTHLRLGLVDRNYQVSQFEIRKTREILQGDRPVQRLIDTVSAYIAAHLGDRLPAAVAVGFPSTVDRTRRVVMSTPNIPGLNDLPVADLMEQALGVPVFVNRDVNFLMLHDLLAHDLEGLPIVLGFYVGTGFGNAVFLDGRLLTGRHGMAAELGHVPLFRLQDRCGCGNPGCAEIIASGLRLERIQQEQFPDVPLEELFIRHASHPALRQFVEDLSLPIATEINIFDPDCIILGGGILHMEGFPRAELEAAIYRHARKPYPGLDFRIIYAAPNQESGVIGAGIYAYKRLQNPSYL